MAGKTDIRWGDGEWAALERVAASWGMTPGRVAKAIVLDRLPVMAGARVVPVVGGPAAPEERESAGAGGGVGDDRRGVGPVGSASSRPAEVERRLARGRRMEHPSAADLERAAFVAGRPVGSAGSGGPVPPAGGGAASVVEPPPAADAPTSEGMPLVEAATRSLLARGLAGSRAQARLMAFRAIRAGDVEVSGEVCRDPERLVDPAELA